MDIQTLNLDLETYSEVNLQKSGLHKYVAHPSFEIMLISFSFNHGPVRVWDASSGEQMPAALAYAITSNKVLKYAWNAQFERVCLGKYFKRKFNPRYWICTMAAAARATLPLKLGDAAIALGIPQRKDIRGYGYIRKFCIPCKPTTKNNNKTRILPSDDIEAWRGFVEYCATDTAVEMAIADKILGLPIHTEHEALVYCLDQKINDRGILIDMDLVENAIRLDEEYRGKITKEVIEFTGITNPKSVPQFKRWLLEEIDEEVESLNKNAIPSILKKTDSELVKKALYYRSLLTKSSVKKYARMGLSAGIDNRIRGTLQYYGARTGRFAGRVVQFHNLPRNSMKPAELEQARNLVLSGDLEMLEILYDNVSDVLSQLIRTAIIPAPGSNIIAADYSAIEARVLAWLAGEQWRLDIFKGDGKIYEASASKMFNVPIKLVTEELRQKGKIAELALGYQGADGALAKMDQGGKIPESQYRLIVDSWRQANPLIVQYWYDVDEAAVETVKTGETTTVRNIRFEKRKNNLYIVLPSGRRLTYLNARIIQGKYGDAIAYDAQMPNTKKWGKVESYGGKFVENITQAVARDILVDAMLRLDAEDFDIIFHVHDEIVTELPKYDDRLEDMAQIMTTAPEWATGLPLAVKLSSLNYYQKD